MWWSSNRRSPGERMTPWSRSNLLLTSAAVVMVLYCVVMARVHMTGQMLHRTQVTARAEGSASTAMRGTVSALKSMGAWKEQHTKKEAVEVVQTPLLHGSALVSPSWLLNNLQEDLLVLDCNPLDIYRQGHIPRALPFVMASTLLKDQTPKATGVVSIDEFEDIVSSLKIPKDATVVFYDDSKSLKAVRMWWVFRHYGFPVERLKVLDGGLKRWVADGNNMTNGDAVPIQSPTELWTNVKDTHKLVGLNVVQQAIADGATQFVDGRTPDEYNGKDHDGNARAGHIPGAVNFNWLDAINVDTGRFKPKDELEAIIDQLHMDKSLPVITYCQRAIRGAHVAFTLERVLGFKNVRVYENSMLQYLNRNDTQVE